MSILFLSSLRLRYGVYQFTYRVKLDCSNLYSEDYQHGYRFESVRIVNPFLG